ncbi:MAG: hypothetical protein AAB597_01205 [Patescibacteria group bacterium]
MRNRSAKRKGLPGLVPSHLIRSGAEIFRGMGPNAGTLVLEPRNWPMRLISAKWAEYVARHHAVYARKPDYAVSTRFRGDIGVMLQELSLENKMAYSRFIEKEVPEGSLSDFPRSDFVIRAFMEWLGTDEGLSFGLDARDWLWGDLEWHGVLDALLKRPSFRLAPRGQCGSQVPGILHSCSKSCQGYGMSFPPVFVRDSEKHPILVQEVLCEEDWLVLRIICRWFGIKNGQKFLCSALDSVDEAKDMAHRYRQEKEKERQRKLRLAAETRRKGRAGEGVTDQEPQPSYKD